jgi:hypothetical protein
MLKKPVFEIKKNLIPSLIWLEMYLNLYLSSSCELGDLFEPIFVFRTVVNQHVN